MGIVSELRNPKVIVRIFYLYHVTLKRKVIDYMETFCEKKSGKNLQGKNYRGVCNPLGCIMRVNNINCNCLIKKMKQLQEW